VIDLNDLQLFAHVARLQSFTRAAEALALPKSSVSRALSRLEGRLGVRLVERTTRSVSLTEAGEVYLDRCRRVLEEAEQADLSVGALQATPRGTLRVGAPIAFARAMLTPVLGEFLSAHPLVRLHLQLLSGEAAPRERGLDVVIRPGPLEDSGLLVKPLIQVRVGAYASPAYLAARAGPATPAALREHECLTTTCGAHGEPTDSAVWRLRRGSAVQEVRVEPRAAVPDPVIAYQLALGGAGIALLSQQAVRHDLAGGRLVRVLPGWEPEPVDLHAVYASRLSASPKVRAFLQFLRERFKSSLTD
jgi:DNA-binding transcriptional LysR family regulator